MRHLFETAARALRARRELVTAAAVTIVAAMLTAGGQGNLAAIVAAGAAGVMAGRAEKNRLFARDARRQVGELREELSNTQESLSLMNRLVHEREDDLSWVERQVRLSLADGRKTIGEYKNSPHSPYILSEVLREWAQVNDGLETVINNATQEELVGEQTQLADLYDTEEVNTNDDAEE